MWQGLIEKVDVYLLRRKLACQFYNLCCIIDGQSKRKNGRICAVIKLGKIGAFVHSFKTSLKILVSDLCLHVALEE